MELACEEEEGVRIIRHTPRNLTSYSLDVGPFYDLSNMQQEKETKLTLVVNLFQTFFCPCH